MNCWISARFTFFVKRKNLPSSACELDFFAVSAVSPLFVARVKEPICSFVNSNRRECKIPLELSFSHEIFF